MVQLKKHYVRKINVLVLTLCDLWPTRSIIIRTYMQTIYPVNCSDPKMNPLQDGGKCKSRHTGQN